MAHKLAWIGLGNMGRGMCKNLVEKGNLSERLILYNRSTWRAKELSENLGASKTEVADSIESAVSSADIVFTCVGDDKAILETIETAFKVDVAGKLFIDCSTVHPDTTHTLDRMIQERKAEFIACPVFGAPAMADAGQLVMVIAGPERAVEKLKPYTTGVMGRSIIDLSSQDPGKASLLKLIGNTFVFNLVEAIAQGHTMAEKTGLGVDNLHKFIEQMFPGPYTAYSNRMRDGDYFKREKPLFAVDLAIKDATHALALAEKSGAKLPGMELAKNHLEAVEEHQGRIGDIAGIYGAVRKESGLPFENETPQSG